MDDREQCENIRGGEIKLMMAYIKAISYYLPEKVVTNEELVKEFPEWSVDKVAQKVGVDSRHVAAEDETACAADGFWLSRRN